MFVWISEQRAVSSVYSINSLAFITERKCVYCAVRTGYVNIIQVTCSLLIFKHHFKITCGSVKVQLREVPESGLGNLLESE